MKPGMAEYHLIGRVKRMNSNVKNIYRRVALWLCLCLTIGILPASSDVSSASSPTVKLIIVGKDVSKKTYKVKKGHKRQLNVITNNTFGTTTVKYTSSNKNLATVNSKGFITTKKNGTVKISVKVTCKNRKRKRSTTTWTKIKIVSNNAASSPSPSPTTYLGGAMQAVLIVNGANAKQFPMTILDNECGRMLYNALPKTLYFTDSNKNVKTCDDPDGLIYPMDDYKPKNLYAGDFMLFGNARYELTYEDHSSGYAYTRLGKITNATGLKSALGTGAVSVTIIRSSLPSSPTPTPSLTPKPSVSPTASGSPNPSASASVKPSSSGSPNPSASASGSPNPSASSSVKPSGSPTASASAKPTTAPVTGPRIKVEADGSQNYIANINTSSTAAMALYNMLSYDKSYVIVMAPYTPVDRYYGAKPAGLPDETQKNDVTRWSAGSLVLIGNYLMIFRQPVNNMGADGKGLINSTVIATIDPSEVENGSGWLKTMFNGSETCTVELWKA